MLTRVLMTLNVFAADHRRKGEAALNGQYQRSCAATPGSGVSPGCDWPVCAGLSG